MIIALLAAAALNAVSPTPPSPTAHRVQLPDGRYLALYCIGAGRTTVIFDSGLGMSASVWRQVQAKLQPAIASCSFDRAGYGMSDAGPLPRDAEHTVSDLRYALRAASIDGPFVLVGHSAGAWAMRLFASETPRQVAGMVLVEPSIDEALLRAASLAFVRAEAEEDATAGKCIRAAATGSLKPGAAIYAECGSPPPGSQIANPSLARTVLSEQASEPASERELAKVEKGYGRTPLLVLTGGAQFAPDAPFPAGASASELNALRKIWRDGHDQIARRSKVGMHRVVERAPHAIQLARPEVVVEAIREVVAASTP